MKKTSCDIIIVGSGMTGLCSGLEALSLGAKVIMIEKNPEPGGTTRLSGGIIWTCRSLDLLRQQIPDGDPDLQRVLISNFDKDLDWLEKLGANLTPELETFEVGKGKMLMPGPPEGPTNFCIQFAQLFKDKGGILFLQTPLVSLLRRGDANAVEGVVAIQDDQVLEIKSKSVVLASGGFPANYELLTKYVGINADKLILRCNRGNTGDGFLAALELGAATSRGLHTFYGHSMAAPPARIDNSNLIAASQHYSVRAIVVNINGERFTDESEGLDETIAQDTLKQTDSKAFIVLDAEIKNKYSDSPSGEADELQTAINIGCNVVTASTLEDLCSRSNTQLGLEEHNLLRTLTQFNKAAREGTAPLLPVPKKRWVNEIKKPPFFCVPIAPSITFTMGGLKINSNSEVISRITSKPIGGLFAAGNDAGGLNYRKYMGSLSACLVFGRLAGRRAAEFSVKRNLNVERP